MNHVVFLKKLDALIGPLLARLFPRSSAVTLPLDQIKSVLFIRPGGIGDAALLIPTIRALKVACPQARVEVLSERRNCAVWSMCSEVEKNYCYDLPGDWPKFCLKKYDLIVDTEQWYYLSAIIGRMLRARCRCGFATNLRGRLFSVTAEYRQDDYEPISFYHLLDALSISRPNEIPEAFLKVSQDATRAVGNMLEGVQTPFVAFFPGASVVEKCWAVDKFRAVAKHVRDIGFGVVLVGGPQERDVAEQILPSMGGAVNFAGCLSLMETAAVLEKAQLVISGDSGLLHLALGVGGKTISVFGPTNDKKWAPRGNGHHVVKCAVPCSPCARYGTIPTCLYDCRCMNGIKSEQVLAAIDSALLPKA